MKTHFVTVDNAWPALKERGMAGTLPQAEAFPLQAFASDLHYTILPNGVLTSLFSAACPSEIGFSRMLDGLPPCSGLQLYTHHTPDADDRKFLTLSALVDYRCPFSPMQGLGSMLTGGAISRELEHLELATREAYAVLIRCAEPDSRYLQLLGNPTPLLQVLGPMRLCEASLESTGAITYNLSYLLLGASRLAILIEFNSFPDSGQQALPHPSGDLEYLAATCIHQPPKDDLAKLDSEVEEYLTFLRYFRKPGPVGESGRTHSFPLQADQRPVMKGRVLAKHYVLVFGSSLTDLRLKAQDYFRDLCRAGISFHASMIRTRESYSHLYPGNFRLLNDGVRMEAAQVPGTLRRLHP